MITFTELMALIGAILTISTIIARYTKTKKDDVWVQKARRFFEKVSQLGLTDRK